MIIASSSAISCQAFSSVPFLAIALVKSSMAALRTALRDIDFIRLLLEYDLRNRMMLHDTLQYPWPPRLWTPYPHTLASTLLVLLCDKVLNAIVSSAFEFGTRSIGSSPPSTPRMPRHSSSFGLTKYGKTAIKRFLLMGANDLAARQTRNRTRTVPMDSSTLIFQ
ncbi:hypothetical protein B0H19DRAFT_1183735, partial [Mycena capillaripes]